VSWHRRNMPWWRRPYFELKVLAVWAFLFWERLGIVKDVLLVDAQTRADVEFTAANPGRTLFHCHQQNHMDLGFMMLFDYV